MPTDQGASPGLVAAGILPVVWLPAFATLETALDFSSPIAVRLLERKDLGRTLVAVEMVDTAACVVCLALFQAGVPPAGVVVGYLLGSSVLPLVIDMTEELYLAQAGRGDTAAVARFNAAAYSLSAAVAMLVARPLGAFASAGSLRLVFAANLVLSLIAVHARRHAVRLSPTVPTMAVQDEAALSPGGSSEATEVSAPSTPAGRVGAWAARQAFSAAGTLAGVWTGLALGAERRPWAAFALAALVVVGLTAWLRPRGNRQSRVDGGTLG